ncbi:hypothetical protein ACFPRA_09505 [Sporosarcina soli]|uniref:Uncharacterized protein n=1 Tax=Sporosarcina soli TaxID=334736 RepID=A0ABW0TIA4_9BACL
MRKGIEGLGTLIQDFFELEPYSDSIFLCKSRANPIIMKGSPILNNQK